MRWFESNTIRHYSNRYSDYSNTLLKNISCMLGLDMYNPNQLGVETNANAKAVKSDSDPEWGSVDS